MKPIDFDPEFDLFLTRDIKAPPEVLWMCWTTPEHLMQWFVPKPHQVIACVLDLRPGGACNTTFNVEGTVMENRGVYLEVIPNERLVFTDTYTAGWKPNPEPFMTAIVTFEDLGGGMTRYTAVARHRSRETAIQHEAMGFSAGWGTVATQLEDYAQALTQRQFILTRVIDAPPAMVWRCWTDPAILPQWFGPKGFSCQTKEIDLRAGGQWRFDMIGPDGTVYANRHRFDVMDAPSRIEFRLDADDDATTPYDVVVTLKPEGTGCRLTQIMTLPTAEIRQAALSYQADVMGEQTLDKLAAKAVSLIATD